KYDNRTPNGWAKNALQEFETLYIGGAEPAVVRRASVGSDEAKSRLCAIAKESLTTRMARIVLGTGPWEQARG
ncbi:MAG TPA: hypothetical protein VN065_06330, partial [Bradyrhizobium sp.]|nr:hypothetical protein [Bradyrhizobium sp.]